MIIERDIFEDNGEKASCGYDGGGAINQRWWREERASGCESPRKEDTKNQLQGPRLVALTHPTRPLQSSVGFAFFATLREIWVRTSCFARLRGAEATLPRVPRAALRLPGVRERPPLRSYCGTQSGVAFAESCGFWQLSATLSAIASMVVCKCRQLGQQMPATQIADRLNPHIGWEKGCRWCLACLTATGWRFSAI